jgi:predicted ATPase
MSDAIAVQNGQTPGVGADVLVRRVKILNYKSIAHCDVGLGALTILVGRNGSGKSNFLDALRFVGDGLRTSLDHAIRDRGGIGQVRRRGTGHPRSFAIELELEIAPNRLARYGFEIGAKKNGEYIVKREILKICNTYYQLVAFYQATAGRLERSSEEPMPVAAKDRLYLVHASGLPAFRPIYDALLAMGFYNLNPEAMKALQSPDTGKILRRDGANIAGVLARLAGRNSWAANRIRKYLESIVPGITDVERVALGPMETLEFRQEVAGSKSSWKFLAAGMSDGTLRALGALVAVSQLADSQSPVRLVGIEEPETALHPAASGVLMDALREAVSHTQVLVTTHSPDLLELFDPATDCLLVVQADEGETRIASIDPASRQVIRDHLYSAGELLRMDQLEPDPSDLKRQKQLRMFEDVEVA